MELTKEQLQRVAHYLNVKDITYIDLRMEVFDHIVSDIEAKIVAENLDFETVFIDVKHKWNKHFRDSSSLYFGIMYSAPKIVIDKAKNSSKKMFFIGTFFITFFPILIDILHLPFSGTSQNIMNFLFKYISVLCLLFLVFIFYQNFKIKEKSTYSFVLKTQFPNLFFGFIPIFIPSYFTNENVLDYFYLMLLFVLILSTVASSIFFRKHIETIREYKVA
ncbi:hypothetical protein CW731_11160 [Polaribacter sp. ALD11]|uniref:hypothetical protein n=1 Tax=Polaribacter sp. ALD11 TaxID=2058137 RepID=UPI000C31B31E|nr:hypothetical protein [Polaribacter sp. ALD11]AUC85810.1 hypothetical protein CW731_11160 [Polaribacter sp. ALD11]